MKREDFKKITDEHFKVCEKFIENKGKCLAVCSSCPFSGENLVASGSGCGNEGYANFGASTDKEDIILVKSAKEFLKLRPSRLTVVKIDEEELEKFKNQKVRLATSDDKEEHDAVNSPVHYQLEVNGMDIEVKDLIKAIVKNMNGTKAYYVGNIIKYIMRAEKKNGIEDYKKARKYLDFVIGEIGE